MEKVDSLKSLVITAKETELPNLYNELVIQYAASSYDSSGRYVSLALEASKKVGDISNQARATRFKGILFSGQNKFEQAIDANREAIELAGQVDDYDLQAICYNNIGYICHMTFQLERGLENLFEGLRISEEYQLEDKTIRGLLLGNIAACYTLMEDHKTALRYLRDVISYAKQIESKSLELRFCDEISICLIENDLDEEAYSTAKKCVEDSEVSGYSSAEMNAKLALSKVLFKKGDFQAAIAMVNESEQLATKIGHKHMVPDLLLFESKILAKQNNISQAIVLAKRALTDVELLRSKQAADITDHLSQLYLQKKDYKNAMDYQSQHLDWTKADQEQKVVYKAAELETKYKSKTQENTIEFLSKERQLKEQTNRLYLTAVGFLSFLLLIGLFLYREKQRSTLQLKELNTELKNTQFELRTKHDDLEKYIESNIQLEQFAHVASHDLRAPIITIKNFSDLLSKKARPKLDVKENQYLNYVKENAIQMESLVTDLLEYSKINSQKLNIESVDTYDLVFNVCDMFEHAIGSRDIEISIVGKLPKVQADKVKLKRVFQNLISNAVKFSDPERKNQISIYCEDSDDFWIFYINDTGIGMDMSSGEIDVLKPYKQLNRKQEYPGTGMGLAICQKIIQKHGGDIRYFSEFGVGSKFYFKISKF